MNLSCFSSGIFGLVVCVSMCLLKVRKDSFWLRKCCLGEVLCGGIGWFMVGVERELYGKYMCLDYVLFLFYCYDSV